MDKYVNVNKIKAKVISGEPVLFSEATQHEIFFLLELEPSEDVEPVTHAHWIPQYPNKRTGKAYSHTCSRCGRTVYNNWQVSAQELGYAFCPHCGARMDEETEK